MKSHLLVLVVIVGLILSALEVAEGDEIAASAKPGQVSLPLETYNTLVARAADPKHTPRPAPAGYSLSQADLHAIVTTKERFTSAQITVRLNISVLEDEWVQIPILPAGTPVRAATVGEKTVELITTANGLAWGSKTSGNYVMTLVYSVDANASEGGISLGIPVPQAASITFAATINSPGIEPVVIPSAGTKISSTDTSTEVTATIPTASGIQLAWRTPQGRTHSLNRALYTGALTGKAVHFRAEFGVDIFTEESFTLKLFPSSVTLSDISVDGAHTSIMVSDGYFATALKGRGAHKVSAEFEVPVLGESGAQREEGLPHIELNIPQIPVSQIQLSLPGNKEVTVAPLANVSLEAKGDATVASTFVPMTAAVTLSWSEAVPDEIKAEVQASAALYHSALAEEGVLSLSAIAMFNITRGESSAFEFELPKEIQVNRVRGPEGFASDWRIAKADKDSESDKLQIFLDRPARGEINFTINYDESLKASTPEGFALPLLRPVGVYRDRGMVALLSSKEFTLKPVSEENITRVGENQLPAAVKQTLQKTVAHTFKYSGENPRLFVSAAQPERTEGKFDATVNTLISLGDASLKGAGVIDLNIKSGKLSELTLELPSNVNVLGLTAPSLRTYKVNPAAGKQAIDVQFTQDMDGDFRLEVNYEFIVSETEAELVVPTLKVLGAEVEQGRIAVEALSAVEVQAASTEHLTYLEPSELPQQLVLNTTNPILLAYKYVHVEPAYKLSLRVARHKQIEVQSATIDSASYQTLFTKDGLAVTTAQFLVRNSRKQFLRVSLPPGAVVWSATVDGRSEKPAIADDKETSSNGRTNVLVKIINSAEPFPVNVIYQTPVSNVGLFGFIAGELPSPDIIVTRTRWDIYLPDDIAYGRLDTNMTALDAGTTVTAAEMRSRVALDAAKSAAVQSEPLQIIVPTSGIRYSFEKLYANQGEGGARFSIAYLSKMGSNVATGLSLIAVLLGWIGVRQLVVKGSAAHSRDGTILICLSVGLLWTTLYYLGVNYLPALGLLGLMLLGTAASEGREHLAKMRLSVQP